VEARIAGAAEGNPLFVEEMVSMLIDDGLLRRQNGSWEVSADLGSVTVPPTIQALLAARLDRLDADERAVIQAASVAGKEFSVDDVAAIAPEQLAARASTVMTSLMRKELIRPDQAGARDAFRFRHILIRDAAYNAISKQQRAESHERFADWLETNFPERRSEYEEIIGYHLEQAHGYRSSLGPLDESAHALALRAGEHLASAGRRAGSRGDATGAVNLIERALGLAPDGWEGRTDALVRLGDQLYEAGEYSRALATMRVAEERARAAGDLRTEWLMKVVGATVEFSHMPSRSLHEVRSVAQESIKMFEPLDDKQGLANAYNLMAWTHNALGETKAMLETALKAVGYARDIGAESLEAQIFPMVGSALYWGPTPVSEALALHRSILQREFRSPVLRNRVTYGAGMLIALRGDVDEGRRLLEAQIATSEDLGQIMNATSWRGFGLGNAELTRENWAGAATEIKAAIETLSAAGETGVLSTLAGTLAMVLYEAGSLDEAFRYTEISDEAADKDDLASQMVWRAARGEVLAARGDGEGALILANEAVQIAEGGEMLMWHCDARMARGEVYRLLGRKEEAAVDFARALELYEKKEAPLHAARARRKLAEVTT
jgi:tetratricopeptide (TPR) repeat protein